MREKTLLTHTEAFEGMQAFWTQKVMKAKAVVLIGVRYVPGDEHIWQSLLDSEADLLVVDPSFDAIESWGAKRARKPRHVARFFSEVPIIQEEVRTTLTNAD